MKSLLLYSGGLDSTYLLHRDKPDAALFIRYGQKHLKEYWFARQHCEDLGIPLHDLEGMRLMGSSLVGGQGNFVVPARNLFFVSLAANFAEANGFGEILLGCNKDDHKAFPDCRSNFWIGVTEVLKLAELKVIIRVPLINFTKRKIMKELDRMGVDLDSTWSCYEGGEEPCGECEACLMRKPWAAETVRKILQRKERSKT